MTNKWEVGRLISIVAVSLLFVACQSTSGRTRPVASGPGCAAGQVSVCDGGTGSSVSDMARRDPAFCSCRPVGQIGK